MMSTLIVGASLVSGLSASASAAPNKSSEADISVVFDSACLRVRVQAAKVDNPDARKNLSYVTIDFVDGTSEQYTELGEPRFFYTSTGAVIASVTAKSGTTTISADCTV